MFTRAVDKIYDMFSSLIRNRYEPDDLNNLENVDNQESVNSVEFVYRSVPTRSTIEHNDSTESVDASIDSQASHYVSLFGSDEDLLNDKLEYNARGRDNLDVKQRSKLTRNDNIGLHHRKQIFANASKDFTDYPANLRDYKNNIEIDAATNSAARIETSRQLEDPSS